MKKKEESLNKTWGGRFNKGPSPLMSAYTDSQHYDRKLYAKDIRASQAHASMLARQGIITGIEAQTLIAGLELVLKEIEDNKFSWKPELEDVHMNIEARLTELVGETGKKLHTARSRNDQVGLSFRLYVSDSVQQWLKACVKLCETLCGIASRHKTTILPGLTHLQPAQPVSLAQHLLAYASMFRRDAERLSDSLERVRISPLGAAALAGSTYPVDPISVATELGFEKIYTNSMDAVSDRDFVLETIFDACTIMAHLSRLCEELIIWSNPAWNYIRLPDSFSTGSSIMPQKKNPDVCELMRGKCGRVYGHLMGALTMMKGLPLAYNRDMQEDKESFFDTDSTVLSSLEIMNAMLAELKFNEEAMANACKRGFINATELADYLAGKGIPFREAHFITGKLVALAEQLGKGLEELSIEQLKEIEPLIDDDVYKALDYSACIKRRESPGGTGPHSVDRQLDDFAEWLRSFI